MQHNVFFVELLGDEPLSGVLIPVVIDTNDRLDDSRMSDIARVLNNYRTVFVKSDDKDILQTKIYSVHGEVSDCLYSNVATVYSLTELSFIRELELGAREMIVATDKCSNRVLISYEDNEVMSVEHKLPLPAIEIAESNQGSGYISECIRELNSRCSTRIIYTEDPVMFSKIRKSNDYYVQEDQDYIVVYYDADIQNVFFYVKRTRAPKDNRLDSRAQISLMSRYLLDKNIDKSEIKSFSHVLNTGQYAVIQSDIQEDTVNITMESRNMVEGIMNL